MGIRGGDRDIMSGKPRRKKGEALTYYNKRVREWQLNKVAENVIIKPSCGTCYHWGENNQCFRYPRITVTTERHRCGEHKTK